MTQIQPHEWRTFYRQFLRYGHQALGLKGLETKIYTAGLRRRFAVASRPSSSLENPTTSNNNKNNDTISSYDRETWVPKLQNTLQLIRNAAVLTSASPSDLQNIKDKTKHNGGGGYPMEKLVLKQLVHYEYGIEKYLKTRPDMNDWVSRTLKGNTAEARVSVNPLNGGGKEKRGDLETAMALQAYYLLIRELNESMNMCI